jgi:type II secretory pathway pseudopilin PulG
MFTSIAVALVAILGLLMLIAYGLWRAEKAKADEAQERLRDEKARSDAYDLRSRPIPRDKSGVLDRM